MNGKQLKHREPAMAKSAMPPNYADRRRHAVAKGVGLCAVAFVLIFATSGHSGRMINSSEPWIESHPGQFAAYFFAGFAGICGLDLIRKS